MPKRFLQKKQDGHVMKKMVRFRLSLLSACCVAALQGCGGGGGDAGSTNIVDNGQSSSSSSGSNSTNSQLFQADGTVKIADNINRQGISVDHKVTLDDSGKAVAMWLSKHDTRLMSVESDETGQRWNAPQIVGEGWQSDFDIRTNGAGQRVALEQYRRPSESRATLRLYFYSAQKGWSAPVPIANGQTANDPANSDLTVLEDGTATLSIDPSNTMYEEASRIYPDGTRKSLQRVIPLLPSGAPLTWGQWGPLSTVFAVAPRRGEMPSHGYLLWQNDVVSNTPDTGSNVILGALGTFIERPAVTMSATMLYSLPKQKWNSDVGCAKGLLKATSVDDRYAVVLSGGLPSADSTKCVLNATRIARFAQSNNVKNDALSARDASVEWAQLMTDENGNSLVVWREKTDDFRTPRYMWSQSVAYGNWTTPANISSSIDFGNSTLSRLAIKMNDKGQAVLAYTMDGLDPNGRRTIFQRSVAYGRFDFQHGWSPVTQIARTAGISDDPIRLDAAINSTGNAVVTYQFRNCDITQNVNDCSVSSLFAYAL
ncbi:hypothetical protein FAZ95_01780 [Trinickia violacea]|uniref:Exo-alpha-sialidase n=1 Tax=Trinickia violacea TaxID=2571746 RepID=A0A4P8IMG0_9BURK|nr:hypothetical protein [Trinickia violacea]QCP48023.1 hypothetical protein FAZ95_01780 [Trinickia violacea]